MGWLLVSQPWRLSIHNSPIRAKHLAAADIREQPSSAVSATGWSTASSNHGRATCRFHCALNFTLVYHRVLRLQNELKPWSQQTEHISIDQKLRFYAGNHDWCPLIKVVLFSDMQFSSIISLLFFLLINCSRTSFLATDIGYWFEPMLMIMCRKFNSFIYNSMKMLCHLSSVTIHHHLIRMQVPFSHRNILTSPVSEPYQPTRNSSFYITHDQQTCIIII